MFYRSGLCFPVFSAFVRSRLVLLPAQTRFQIDAKLKTLPFFCFQLDYKPTKVLLTQLAAELGDLDWSSMSSQLSGWRVLLVQLGAERSRTVLIDSRALRVVSSTYAHGATMHKPVFPFAFASSSMPFTISAALRVNLVPSFVIGLFFSPDKINLPAR